MSPPYGSMYYEWRRCLRSEIIPAQSPQNKLCSLFVHTKGRYPLGLNVGFDQKHYIHRKNKFRCMVNVEFMKMSFIDTLYEYVFDHQHGALVDFVKTVFGRRQGENAWVIN